MLERYVVCGAEILPLVAVVAHEAHGVAYLLCVAVVEGGEAEVERAFVGIEPDGVVVRI